MGVRDAVNFFQRKQNKAIETLPSPSNVRCVMSTGIIR